MAPGAAHMVSPQGKRVGVDSNGWKKVSEQEIEGTRPRTWDGRRIARKVFTIRHFRPLFTDNSGG